jgi:hypothetical protein
MIAMATIKPAIDDFGDEAHVVAPGLDLVGLA